MSQKGLIKAEKPPEVETGYSEIERMNEWTVVQSLTLWVVFAVC